MKITAWLMMAENVNTVIKAIVSITYTSTGVKHERCV